jgi:hypothetical protein
LRDGAPETTQLQHNHKFRMRTTQHQTATTMKLLILVLILFSIGTMGRKQMDKRNIQRRKKYATKKVIEQNKNNVKRRIDILEKKRQRTQQLRLEQSRLQAMIRYVMHEKL